MCLPHIIHSVYGVYIARLRISNIVLGLDLVLERWSFNSVYSAVYFTSVHLHPST